jgi:death on curing protein
VILDEPIWILDDVVPAIHQRQLAEHGGLDGVRDTGGLASALARPKNLLAYGQPKPDLAALAASYTCGIIRNHPFVDGNKRTAYVVCRTFLNVNQQDIDATDVEKYLTFVGVADSSLSEEALADWIRMQLVKLSQ